MIQWTRLWPWLGFVLVAALVIAAALWMQGTLPGSSVSPVSLPENAATSPLATPSPGSADNPSPPALTRLGAILMWMVVGAVLALGIAFLYLRAQLRDVR